MRESRRLRGRERVSGRSRYVCLMTPRGHAGFADIEFGFADAAKESARNPDLLLHAYLDDSNLVAKALKGEPFLFLGYKGSGKTAIAERANLLQRTDPRMFVSIEQLTDFSYAEFKTTAGGSADHHTRYPMTWGYLLLLALLKSLERDEGGRQRAPREYTDVVAGLTALGLMPVPKLGELVTRTSKRVLRAGIPKFLESVHESVRESHELRMTQMVAVLQQAIDQFDASSRHVIFVDGLDDVISQRDLQFQSLAALVREVDRLNNVFDHGQRPFKFVVLCRTDIFDRLPGANTSKLRQDSAVELDWYDDPRHPERTKLVRLANIRARASLHRSFDVFDEYLPAKIENRGIRGYLLDRTRHTPRDLLQLLKRIQLHAGRTDRLTVAQVKAGVRDYSNNYFIGELRNELEGYVSHDEIHDAITLLTSFSTPRLTMRALQQQAAKLGYTTLDLNGLVAALFNCSAIGTIDESPGNGPRFTFKFRNRNSSLVPGSVMWVHPGAWGGFNMSPERFHGRPGA